VHQMEYREIEKLALLLANQRSHARRKEGTSNVQHSRRLGRGKRSVCRDRGKTEQTVRDEADAGRRTKNSCTQGIRKPNKDKNEQRKASRDLPTATEAKKVDRGP